MARPFEGIRVIDVTHVLAGPFATFQLAVLGADVIKVEHPDEPDQSRGSGTDKALNRAQLGTSFLAQASNKRAITLDLKTEHDRATSSRSWSQPRMCSLRTTGPVRLKRSVLAIRRYAPSIRASSMPRSRHSATPGYIASAPPTTM